MKFDGEIDRRLTNWARWCIARQEGGRIGTVSMDERVDGAGWDTPTVIPLLDAEAEETQGYVARLESVQRYAVTVWYVHPGSVATRCAKIAASETVVRGRVALAQRQIGQMVQDRREAAERERARVAGLQRGLVAVNDLDKIAGRRPA